VNTKGIRLTYVHIQTFDSPVHGWVMVVYESDLVPEDDPELVKLSLPFHFHENPSKIMCFFVVDGEQDTRVLVQSCCESHHHNDSILFQSWS